MASCAKLDGLAMRHRIAIQEESRTENGAGGFVHTWATVKSAWASIDPVSGWEKFQAAQMETDITHKIVIRYQSGITTKNRILFGARTFNVVEVLNVEERNAYLYIKAVEGAAT